MSIKKTMSQIYDKRKVKKGARGTPYPSKEITFSFHGDPYGGYMYKIRYDKNT